MTRCRCYLIRRCFACYRGFEIGSGHYNECKVRIKIDELDKKYRDAHLTLIQLRRMAKKELKKELKKTA